MTVSGKRLMGLAALLPLLWGAADTAAEVRRETASPMAERREAREVFGKWMPLHGPDENQRIIADMNLAGLRLHRDPAYGGRVMAKYRAHGDYMKDIAPLVTALFGRDLRTVTEPSFEIPAVKRAALARLCGLMERDMGAFLENLRRLGLESADLNERELPLPPVESYVRYTTLLELLVTAGEPAADQARAVAAANRLAEYCFGDAGWPAFEAVLMNADAHPLARFVYANLWFFLSGTGWKHWHRDAIARLKRAHDAGARVVYIAGGNDVYQLLRAGIYRIDVIDPLLPSQPRYYAEGWDYLARGGAIGDEIDLAFAPERELAMPARRLVLRRAAHRAGPSFRARLHTGAIEEIPGGTTVWDVLERSGRRLGRVVFERRFCRQDDFTPRPGREIVMSFNELYFVTTSDAEKGWGIDPDRFAPGLRLAVKQLRRPVTAAMMRRMREADRSPFRFLTLGSEVD